MVYSSYISFCLLLSLPLFFLPSSFPLFLPPPLFLSKKVKKKTWTLYTFLLLSYTNGSISYIIFAHYYFFNNILGNHVISILRNFLNPIITTLTTFLCLRIWVVSNNLQLQTLLQWINSSISIFILLKVYLHNRFLEVGLLSQRFKMLFC